MLGTAYRERLNEIQLVLEGRQFTALGAGLRNYHSVTISMFTHLLMTWYYRLHSAI